MRALVARAVSAKAISRPCMIAERRTADQSVYISVVYSGDSLTGSG